ncbi:unnamed protein product, partial [Scytosiphon promiscuus]
MASPPRAQPTKETKKVKLKLEYNGSKRVAVVYEGYTFARLWKRLCEDFKFEVFLEYEDTDGDKVMLNSENDLDELLANEEGPVQVSVSAVRDRERVSSPPHPPRTSSSPPPSFPSQAPGGGVPPPAYAALSSAGFYPPHPNPLPRQEQQPYASQSGSDRSNAAPPTSQHHPSPPQTWLDWSGGSAKSNVLEGVAVSPSGSFASGDGGGAPFRGRGTVGGSFGGVPGAAGSSGIGGSPIVPRVTRGLGSEGPNPWQWGDEVDPVRWLRGDVIGEGAFGTVHMGLNLDTGELMAVKSISLDQGDMTPRDAKAFENEIAILRDNKHENIVRSFGSSTKGQQICIFLEYMPGGSVRHLLDRFGALEETMTLLYAKQLLRGLSFLHRNGVAHRDIKCANCLVDQRGAIKLADFGMSKRIVGLSGTSGNPGVQSVKGTPFWMAPEVLQVQDLRDGWMKADVWSLGATILEMASGSPPWGTIGPLAAMFKISCTRDLPAIPEEVSAAAKDLIRQCFSRDPSLRPSVDDLLRHPTIVEVSTASRRNSAPAFRRTPRQQTTAVPYAAREQVVPAFHALRRTGSFTTSSIDGKSAAAIDFRTSGGKIGAASLNGNPRQKMPPRAMSAPNLANAGVGSGREKRLSGFGFGMRSG